MSESILTLPLRAVLRGTRAGLLTGRAAANQALAVIEILSRIAGDGAERHDLDHDRFVPSADGAPISSPVVVADPDGLADVAVSDDLGPESVAGEPPLAPEPVAAELGLEDGHLVTDAELVRESADPAAADGAGAEIRVEPPWPNYDALKAADIVARLRGTDPAQLAAIELYESTHRKRRTVTEAVRRESRRPR